MFDNFKGNVVPHLIGLVLMFIGWFVSIASIKIMALLRPLEPSQNTLFGPATIVGLLLIIIGAYLPDMLRKKKA